MKRLISRLLRKLKLYQQTKQIHNIYKDKKRGYNLKKRVSKLDRTKFEVGSKRDVIIICVDCLRNDRVSKTGYRRKTTPYLDKFEYYAPAVSAAPWTFSSVPSILTGLYPHNHGAAYKNDSSRNQDMGNPPRIIDDDVYTIAELLKQHGYKTYFSTGVGTARIPINGRFGIQRHGSGAEEILKQTKKWWNKTNSPKFSYIHLGDLHNGNIEMPDEEYFDPIPDELGVENWRFQCSKGPKDEFDSYRDGRELLYDTVVRDIDKHIKNFLSDIENDPIIVVTSDHGEEFWEYLELERKYFLDPRGTRSIGHGHALVPSVIEVPILIDGIDLPKINTPVSTTDIAPTIINEIFSNFSWSFDGLPLQKGTNRPVISEEIAYGPNQISVTQNEYHLIHTPSRNQSILLERGSSTPIENQDIKRELESYIPESSQEGREITLSDQTIKQLADLGYADSS